MQKKKWKITKFGFWVAVVKFKYMSLENEKNLFPIASKEFKKFACNLHDVSK